MSFDILIDKCVSSIKEQVILWNNFSRFPLKGEMWEERLSNGFANAGEPNDWEPDGNHTPGIDMSLDNSPFSFSNKSGVVKDGILTISSYRTTKFKTLQEKLDYHDSKKAKPFTHYAFIVRDSDDTTQTCVFVEKDYINAKSLSWKENYGQRGKGKGEHNGWSGKSKKIEMKIQISMSGQFWYYLNWEELINSDQCKVAFIINHEVKDAAAK